MNRFRDTAAAALAGGFLLCIGCAAFWRVPRGEPAPLDVYLVFLGAAFVVYAGMLVWLVKRPPGRWVLLVWMLTAVLARCLMLAAPHRPNSDIQRYLWDGHVLASGFNPYAHAPADPSLEGIRGTGPYERMNPAYNHIRTVYGPVAMCVFAPCAQSDDGTRALRFAMTAADIAAIVVLAALLRRLRLPEPYVLVYALNPLLLDAFAQRGQVDALMLPLLTGAALCAVSRRFGWAGVLLGLSALVKFPPLLCAPVLIAYAGRNSRSNALKATAALAIVVCAGGAFWCMGGDAAFSGLAVFAGKWRANEGLHGLFEAVLGPLGAGAVAAAGTGLTAVLCAFRTRQDAEVPVTFGVVLMALLLLAPAVFPWYLTWLLPLAAVMLTQPRWRLFSGALLWWSAASLLWYLRFFSYPPLAQPLWFEACPALEWACARLREPWRLVEYPPLLVLLTLGFARVWRGHRTLRSVNR